MSDLQDISIIVPAKNNRDTIGATINSVLDQDGIGEVIVCLAPSDDGTDDILRGIKDPRLRLLDDPGQGISLAMNIGIAAATGTYFSKIDADDLVPSGRFGWQRDALLRSPDLVAISGSYQAIDEKGSVIANFAEDRDAGLITPDLLQGETPTHFGTYLTRLDAIRGIGGFREWFVTAEDIDMPLRLANIGEVGFEPITSYQYRIRGSSITHNQPNVLRVFYEKNAREFALQRVRCGVDDLMQGQPPDLPTLNKVNGSDAKCPHDQIAGFLEAQSWRSFNKGQRMQGIALMSKSIKTQPKMSNGRGLMVMLLKCLRPKQ